MKEKMESLDFIQIKNFKHIGENEKTRKRLGENVCKHINDQELISKMYKELLNKKTKNSSKNNSSVYV